MINMILPRRTERPIARTQPTQKGNRLNLTCPPGLLESTIRVGGGKRPTERMKKIFGWLQQNKYPNATWMARELNVSAKTVHRDLRFMQ
jgi:predicted HTH transcriptional regulator